MFSYQSSISILVVIETMKFWKDSLPRFTKIAPINQGVFVLPSYWQLHISARCRTAGPSANRATAVSLPHVSSYIWDKKIAGTLGALTLSNFDTLADI
jgi:hypothetical protein